MITFETTQVFVVAGASSGIGKGVALLLNELSAGVIGIGRNPSKLEALKGEAKFPENLFIEVKDLTDNVEELTNYVKELRIKYGRLAGLAFCAGAAEIRPLRVVTLNAMKAIYDLNVFAPVMMAKGLGDKRNNVGKGTSMVFISSVAAKLSDKGHTSYAGSKSALVASMRSIAKELAPEGIRVNCVLPSEINTPMTDALEHLKADVKQRVSAYPLGLGEVEDVANFVIFLLSEKAKWITAQEYTIDCGSF